MNYRDFTLSDWIEHINEKIEDESTLDGNEMRDLVKFLKTDDLISRQAAIEALGEEPPVWYDGEDELAERDQWRRDVNAIKALPSAQEPEVKPIDYQDCSNAMLKMWMDNVVTDGEYNRIMDKLNAHWRKKNE